MGNKNVGLVFRRHERAWRRAEPQENTACRALTATSTCCRRTNGNGKSGKDCNGSANPRVHDKLNGPHGGPFEDLFCVQAKFSGRLAGAVGELAGIM